MRCRPNAARPTEGVGLLGQESWPYDLAQFDFATIRRAPDGRVPALQVTLHRLEARYSIHRAILGADANSDRSVALSIAPAEDRTLNEVVRRQRAAHCRREIERK